MLGIFKKKAPEGPVVWMLQNRESQLFLGACKHELVHLSDWKGCFRFNDMDAASLMIYWLIQSNKTTPGVLQAVPVRLSIGEKK